ncbi:hypothetical protein LZ009_08915 [Ramlibacter sp. XY19]|uniref:hypothetical protein n=1 Tax=Ramlibacter paludis TaxID=2908000 RepID=UPI0023DBACA2|nr:hypothetical protein [Ramlibacter paludis]MCG2592900.1 hypothetical protein [Ramlibacter paludis]
MHRLMGVSPSLLQGSVVEKLLAMRADFCRFNEARGCRTAVWYSAGWFLEWHEGSAEAVEQAWKASQTFRWLGKHRMVHQSQGPRGLAETLHIATVHSRETPNDVARRIHSVGRQHELGWAAEPAEIWRQLTAPCLLAGKDAMAAVARENVFAVTSETTGSVELVRAIAEQYRGDVVYQRFAGGDLTGPDVGAAYVDLPHDGQVTRVQALSRGALDNSMVRMSLQQAQCLVLLLGNRGNAAARLAQSIVDLLAEQDVWPAVRLVGACAATCESAVQALAALPQLDVAVRFIDKSHRAPVDAVLEAMSNVSRGTSSFVPARVDTPY